MKITEMIGTSFIDYPKEIAMVVFTKGCNMTCPYCHNKELTIRESFHEEEEVFAFLKKRKGLVDAIVISGGEPTLQADLVDFCRRLKTLPVKVKLDTNGTNPKVLKTLIDEELVDYVAMDIKSSPNQYKAISGVSYERVKESVELIKTLETYEFRTTLYPTITEKDIGEIVHWIDTPNYYLQQYRPNSEMAPAAYSDEYVRNLGLKFGFTVRGLAAQSA